MSSGILILVLALSLLARADFDAESAAETTQRLKSKLSTRRSLQDTDYAGSSNSQLAFGWFTLSTMYLCCAFDPSDESFLCFNNAAFLCELFTCTGNSFPLGSTICTKYGLLLLLLLLLHASKHSTINCMLISP